MNNTTSEETAKKHTSIGSAAVGLTASKMVALVISMITTMFLSRFRTTSEYGTYSQILLVINLVVALLMLGLPNSVNYFLVRAEGQEDRRTFLSVYYTVSTILSIVIGIVLVTCLPLIITYFHNEQIGDFYFVLALYPWASIIMASVENVLIVYDRMRALIAYRIFFSIAMLLTVLVIEWLGLNFRMYMILFVAVNAIFAIAVYIIAAKLCGGLRLLIDRKLLKAIFVFSIPIGLAGVVGTFNTEIDKLLIGYLMSTEEMAIYSNAAKELPLSIIGTSITAVLLPQITLLVKKEKDTSALKLWAHATELGMLIVAVIVAGIFVYAEDVITILYSEKYLPGSTVFRIYTLVLLFRVTYFGMMLNAHGKTKPVLWSSIVSLVLNIILNPLFYYLFGMPGPAAATLLSLFAAMMLQLFMTARILKVHFSEVFPWGRVGIILGINVIFGIIFWALKKILPLEQYIGSMAESLVLGSIWLFIYWLLLKKWFKGCWQAINSNGD